MTDLFKEIIPSIMKTKEDVLTEEKDYVPYVVNRALSFYYDCIFYANQMNMMPHADRRMQYTYLLNSVRSMKRPFQKWLKHEAEDDLEVVKEYYDYSDEKARQALSVLSNEQINEIRRRMDKGGLNVRNKRTN